MKIRADLVRLYKEIHTWVGIVSGFALFIAFYAGAITMFHDPINAWTQAPTGLPPTPPMSQAQFLVDKVLAKHPDAVNHYTIHVGENVPARMSFERPASAGMAPAAPEQWMASLNAQAEVVTRQVSPSPAAHFIDLLHQKVGLPLEQEYAGPIMGVVAVLYTLALVSGVIVLLPSLVKDFFAVRIEKNPKRMWLDVHNMLGLLSLPFHLIMALTSVIFAFHDQIYAVQAAVIWKVEDTAQIFQRPPHNPVESGERLSVEQLYSAAQQKMPDLNIVALEFEYDTDSKETEIHAIGDAPRHLGRGGFLTRIEIDPATGDLRSDEVPLAPLQGLTGPLTAFFSMHFGTFGGTPVRWAYFFLGLAGAFIFYSGNLLWVESRRKRARRSDTSMPAQRRDVRWLASATVGVCLGCVCGISAILAASRWLPAWAGHSAQGLEAWTSWLYYAVFLMCLLWSFARGAARSAVHLLWLASMLTLGIPLTTLLAWAVPAWELASPTAYGMWAIDAAALASALAFAVAARMSARRGREGDVDSVWSTRPRPPDAKAIALVKQHQAIAPDVAIK